MAAGGGEEWEAGNVAGGDESSEALPACRCRAADCRCKVLQAPTAAQLAWRMNNRLWQRSWESTGGVSKLTKGQGEGDREKEGAQSRSSHCAHAMPALALPLVLPGNPLTVETRAQEHGAQRSDLHQVQPALLRLRHCVSACCCCCRGLHSGPNPPACACCAGCPWPMPFCAEDAGQGMHAIGAHAATCRACDRRVLQNLSSSPLVSRSTAPICTLQRRAPGLRHVLLRRSI